MNNEKENTDINGGTLSTAMYAHSVTNDSDGALVPTPEAVLRAEVGEDWPTPEMSRPPLTVRDTQAGRASMSEPNVQRLEASPTVKELLAEGDENARQLAEHLATAQIIEGTKYAKRSEKNKAYHHSVVGYLRTYYARLKRRNEMYKLGSMAGITSDEFVELYQANEAFTAAHALWTMNGHRKGHAPVLNGVGEFVMAANLS